jgi:hypothetical protein
VPRYSVETIEAMQKHLLGYRDNLRVEVESDVPIVARTVAELRTLSTWPGPLILDVHIDLDPRHSVMAVKASVLIYPCLNAASASPSRRKRVTRPGPARPFGRVRMFGF